jgi:hypothetical protein
MPVKIKGAPPKKQGASAFSWLLETKDLADVTVVLATGGER